MNETHDFFDATQLLTELTEVRKDLELSTTRFVLSVMSAHNEILDSIRKATTAHTLVIEENVTYPGFVRLVEQEELKIRSRVFELSEYKAPYGLKMKYSQFNTDLQKFHESINALLQPYKNLDEHDLETRCDEVKAAVAAHSESMGYFYTHATTLLNREVAKALEL